MAKGKRQGRGSGSVTEPSRIEGLEAQVRELEARLQEKEHEIAALLERVARLEAPEPKPPRPWDGRARPRPGPPGPRCPGCNLPVLSDGKRCEFCGFLFEVLPARLKEAFLLDRSGRATQPRQITTPKKRS